MNRSNGDLSRHGVLPQWEETRLERDPAQVDLALEPVSQFDFSKIENNVSSPKKMTATETSSTKQFSPDQQQAIEVDFYKSPTILNRLILNQKYEQAIKRLDREPQEASTWVCARRKLTKAKKNKPGKKTGRYSFRQLPLHTACVNLSLAHDSHIRETLNELIIKLIVAYPAGCDQKDHMGRLPLEEAIRNGAEPTTVAMFFTTNSEQLDSKDTSGQLDSKDTSGQPPVEVCLSRPGIGEPQVSELLSTGQDSWKVENKELALLPKHVPTFSVCSSVTDLVIGSSDIESIAWEQLEGRALAAEQILTETNEQNYQLTQSMRALSKRWFELIEEIGGQDDVVKEVKRLQQENRELKERLLEQAIAPVPHQKAHLAQRKQIGVDVDYMSTKTGNAQVIMYEASEREPEPESEPLSDNVQEIEVLNQDVPSQRRRGLPFSRLFRSLRNVLRPRGRGGSHIISEVSQLTSPEPSAMSSNDTSLVNEIVREINERKNRSCAPHMISIAWARQSPGFVTYGVSCATGTKNDIDDLSGMFRSAAMAELASTSSGTPSSGRSPRSFYAISVS